MLLEEANSDAWICIDYNLYCFVCGLSSLLKLKKKTQVFKNIYPEAKFAVKIW